MAQISATAKVRFRRLFAECKRRKYLYNRTKMLYGISITEFQRNENVKYSKHTDNKKSKKKK